MCQLSQKPCKIYGCFFSPRCELIFNTIDDLEAVLYHDIAKARGNVVGQLVQKVSDNVLVKLIQKILFDHLWLLDPSWDRATEVPAYMESRLVKMFAKPEMINLLWMCTSAISD